MLFGYEGKHRREVMTGGCAGRVPERGGSNRTRCRPLNWFTVTEHQVRCVARHQPGDVRGISCIADDQPVIPEYPKIPACGNWCCGKVRDGILVRQPLGGILLGEQPGKLLIFEAEEANFFCGDPSRAEFL